VLQVVKTIKSCDKNIMQVRNLAMDLNYMFIDARTRELYFIYWPIVNSEVFVNVIEFFSSMPFKVIFDSREDTAYVSEYIGFFRSGDGFSFNNFEKFIMQLAGIGGENSIGHVPTGPASRPEINGRKEQNTGGISKSAAYFPPTEVTHEEYSPEHKTEYTEPRRRAATQNFSETTVLGEDEDPNGGTTVLDDDDGQPAFPHIIREKTGEKIYLDKPSFRIGKEKQYCDYFVSDNNAISRSHADIVTRNNHYYILDNNSTNKTYVDGRAIPAKKEVEIFSGTKLKLANEEFTFYV
ncbi:MAG: FHA domain-containing protein, partial [Pseudomonadota bacterium]